MDDVIVDNKVSAKGHLGEIARTQREDALNGDNERIAVADPQLMCKPTGIDVIHQIQCLAAQEFQIERLAGSSAGPDFTKARAAGMP